MKSGKSMKELSELPGLKRFLDPRLIRALGHPVREHIFAVLNERVASAKEIGDELGADVSSFYHHIEELERLDCIERVETKRRRGAAEHFFRAKRTLSFDDAEWQKLPASLRSDTMVNVLQSVVDEATAAVDAKTFSAREGTHVSWIPAALDAEGWRDATALMNETLERLAAIQDESSKRLVATAGEQEIPATVALLVFETSRSRQAIAA